jgi:ABC-type Mn2+/Zn2+ transport system ATPase subunit
MSGDGDSTRELVTFSGVGLSYGARSILTAVDWTLRAGEAWSVIGPNGAGKSTLLAALLGRHPPAAGSIRRAPDLAGGMASVPQRCGLTTQVAMTVREFVALGLATLPLTGTEHRKRPERVLADCGLSQLGARQVWSLSGGERQRALIARALVRRPLLLALDEPSAGLDLGAECALLALLRTLRQQGLTTVLVTHDMRLAADHGGRIALVSDGALRSGTPAALLAPAMLARVHGLIEEEL